MQACRFPLRRLQVRRRIGQPSITPYRDGFRINLCLSALAPIRASLLQMCGKSTGIEILRMAGAEAVQAAAHEMVQFGRTQDRFRQGGIECAM